MRLFIHQYTMPRDVEMSWSLGETSALVTKAAHGAGMSWGLAEEAGFAVAWLQARNLPGVAVFSRYLSGRDSAFLVNWPEPITNPLEKKSAENKPRYEKFYCPFMVGTAFADGAIPIATKLDKVREPLLLVPFIALRAGATSIKLEIGTLKLQINAAGIQEGCCPNREFLINAATCHISPTPEIYRFNNPDTVSRVPSHVGHYFAILNSFAQKTYAPVSDESRRSGAGAGLNDND